MPILSLLPIPFFVLSVYLYFLSRKTNNLKEVQIYQPLTTVFIMVVALLGFYSPEVTFWFSVIIIIGLSFSFIADLVLVDMANMTVFAVGLGLFFLAILSYNIAMLKFTSLHLTHLIPGIPMLALAIWAFLTMSKGEGMKGAIKIGVGLYVLIFAFLVTQCWGAVISGDLSFPRALFMAIGSTMFFFGDMQMGVNSFAKPGTKFWTFMLHIGPFLYSGGQMCIALSLSV